MKNVFSISPCTYSFWYTCTTQSRKYREVCEAVLPWPRARAGGEPSTAAFAQALAWEEEGRSWSRGRW